MGKVAAPLWKGGWYGVISCSFPWDEAAELSSQSRHRGVEADDIRVGLTIISSNILVVLNHYAE